MPGLVPLTLTDTLTVVSPDITLPELGDVKHTVTVYAPDEGVLVAHELIGLAVGVGVGAGVGAGVAVALGVGFGVRLGLENAVVGGNNNARIRTALINKNTRLDFIIFLPQSLVQAFLLTTLIQPLTSLY